MSGILDGLASANYITARIKALEEQKTSGPTNNSLLETDPKYALLTFQQTLNNMINSLLYSSDEDKEKEDPFASWMKYQNSISSINNPAMKSETNSSNNLDVNSYTGGIDIKNINQYLSAQYLLNFDKW